MITVIGAPLAVVAVAWQTGKVLTFYLPVPGAILPLELTLPQVVLVLVLVVAAFGAVMFRGARELRAADELLKKTPSFSFRLTEWSVSSARPTDGAHQEARWFRVEVTNTSGAGSYEVSAVDR